MLGVTGSELQNCTPGTDLKLTVRVPGTAILQFSKRSRRDARRHRQRIAKLHTRYRSETLTGPRDASDPMFTVYSPGADARSKLVLTLFQDREGGIYCGTGNGLYRIGGR